MEIRDEESANQYRVLAAQSIAAYGGRYLARGAEPLVVEGAATTRRLVIVEFSTLDQIRQWYASPEYARALVFRGAALERRLMFVDGITGVTERP